MLVSQVQKWAAAGACLSMLVTPVAFASPSAATPRDVALQSGGVLVGQLFDAQGAPLAETPVRIAMRGKEVVRTATDKKGVFTVAGLRGGVHEVAAAGQSDVYRFWAPRTAPPAARSGVMMVASGDAVRGQYGEYPAEPTKAGPVAKALGFVADHPFITAAVVATAVAVPLAVDDDDPAS